MVVNDKDHIDVYLNLLPLKWSYTVAKASKKALAPERNISGASLPTGALDYQTGKQVLKLLLNCCRNQGMTVIIITHNAALKPMADHVVTIKNGRISDSYYNPNPVSIDEIEW